jgi:hypothetical protein
MCQGEERTRADTLMRVAARISCPSDAVMRKPSASTYTARPRRNANTAVTPTRPPSTCTEPHRGRARRSTSRAKRGPRITSGAASASSTSPTAAMATPPARRRITRRAAGVGTSPTL